VTAEVWATLVGAGVIAALVAIIHAIAHAIRVRSDAANTAATVELQRENTDHALVVALVARVEAAEARAAASEARASSLEARVHVLEEEREATRRELEECERRSDAMRIEIRDLYQIIQSVTPTQERKR
jgi:hypothetical protein